MSTLLAITKSVKGGLVNSTPVLRGCGGHQWHWFGSCLLPCCECVLLLNCMCPSVELYVLHTESTLLRLHVEKHVMISFSYVGTIVPTFIVGRIVPNFMFGNQTQI